MAMNKLELWSSRHAETCSTLSELPFHIVQLCLRIALLLLCVVFFAFALLLRCFCFAFALLLLCFCFELKSPERDVRFLNEA